MIGSDTWGLEPFDFAKSGVPESFAYCHMNLVARRGIYNFENLDLDDLSADKAYELPSLGRRSSWWAPRARREIQSLLTDQPSFTKRAGFTPCPFFVSGREPRHTQDLPGKRHLRHEPHSEGERAHPGYLECIGQ